jgi:hypothetical protein
MEDKPPKRRWRFACWIVTINWGFSAVVVTGIVLLYLVPSDDRLLTLPGPTYVIVEKGALTAGRPLVYANGELVIKPLDPTKYAGGEFQFTVVGIPRFFRYVRSGGVWHFELSLWCLFGLASAMAAIGTWLFVLRQRSRLRRSPRDRAALYA